MRSTTSCWGMMMSEEFGAFDSLWMAAKMVINIAYQQDQTILELRERIAELEAELKRRGDE